jgi:hypothetical protein
VRASEATRHYGNSNGEGHKQNQLKAISKRNGGGGGSGDGGEGDVNNDRWRR